MFAIAALTISACGSDTDTEADAGSQATIAEVPDDAGAPAATDAAPVVIQNSDVTITGTPLTPFEDPATDPLGVAPVASGASFDGSPISIGGPGQGPTMLVFLAHWCPHCNDEIPELNELRDEGGVLDSIAVIGISTAVASDRDNYPPSEWVVEKDFTWPVLADSVDSAAMLAFGGTGFPFTVMLDAEGNVLGRKSGSSSAADISNWIQSVLA